MSFQYRNRKEKSSEQTSNQFISLLLDAIELIYKKVIQLNEVLYQSSSKNRIINLTEQTSPKYERKSDSHSRTKNEVINFKVEFEEMFSTLDNLRKSNFNKQDLQKQFSPINRIKYQDEKDHQMILFQEKLEKGIKEMEDRFLHVQDDIVEILLICKQTILKR